MASKLCTSRQCRLPMEPGWQFCPYCGTDVRPPTFRPPILACPHLFFEQEGFCFRCGDCRDGRPNASQREVQNSIGKALFYFGFLVIILAVAVTQIHANNWPGNDFIKPWFDETYTDAGKVLVKGNEYVSWAQTGGGVLCGLGILARIEARLNAGKPKRKPLTFKAPPAPIL